MQIKFLITLSWTNIVFRMLELIFINYVIECRLQIILFYIKWWIGLTTQKYPEISVQCREGH